MAIKRRIKTISYLVFLISITLWHSKAYSQTRISGKNQSENGIALAGANVYLLGIDQYKFKKLGLVMEFNPTDNSMKLMQRGKEFDFTKE